MPIQDLALKARSCDIFYNSQSSPTEESFESHRPHASEFNRSFSRLRDFPGRLRASARHEVSQRPGLDEKTEESV
jgi:hypothetical protein